MEDEKILELFEKLEGMSSFSIAMSAEYFASFSMNQLADKPEVLEKVVDFTNMVSTSLKKKISNLE